MNTIEHATHRAHIESVADAAGCRCRWRSCTLYLVDGLYDLFYFTDEQAARRIGALFGGAVLETTAGQIWRVAIRQ